MEHTGHTLTLRFSSVDGQIYGLDLEGPDVGERRAGFAPPYDPATWRAILLALEPSFVLEEAEAATRAALESLDDLGRLHETVGSALADLPLRVLLVLSEPVDASPVFPQQAREELLHGLRTLDEVGAVIVDLLRPPTFDTLVEAVTNGGYHVLVFYGHGVYDEETGGQLLFEDEYGGRAPVQASELGVALRNTDVRLVLLGACQSAQVPSHSRPLSPPGEMEDPRPVHRLAAEYLQAKLADKERGGTPDEVLEEVDQWEQAEAWQELARGTRALVGSLDRLGYWGEIRERLERAREAVVEHLDAPPDLEAGLLSDLAAIVYKSAEWDEAIALWEKAAGLYRATGDENGMAQTYNNLGLVYARKGEWDRAIEFYEKDLPRLGPGLRFG